MLEPNSELGPYRLVEFTSRVGHVEIWTAQAPDGELIALRAQPVRGGHAEILRERIGRDLQLAQRLSHPNVMRTWDAGVEHGWFWTVREPLDGTELAALIGLVKPPPFGVAAYIVEQAARGVAYLHTAPGLDGRPLGALRNDLTPTNLVVTRTGAVKVADSLASETAQSLVDTVGQAQGRSMAYRSPERVEHGARLERSDVFALGVILWELLAGRPLFDGASDREVLDKVRRADVPTLSTQIPDEVRRQVERALRRAPTERHASAEELAHGLAHAVQHNGHASPEGVRHWVESTATPPPSRTEVLSEEEQCPSHPLPSEGLPFPDPDPQLGPLETGFSLVADSPSLGPSDPFFDPTRDGDGINHPRFEVLGRLGTGGMGEVYRVRDRELDEIVALKRIPPHAEDGLRAVDRLKREVRLARRIASDHVCRIHDLVDLGGGDRGLTMELIEGHTLSDLMRTTLVPDYRRFARWGSDICNGLGAAHSVGVIHRDLKPENVMIRTADDTAVILDFGIARRTIDTEATNTRLTQAGIIMGTPLYMAPEQLANQPLDGRADLYGLGLILGELITGEVPLGGPRYPQILERRVVSGELFHVREKDPAIPPALATVIDRLLLPAADDRFSSAKEVEERLRAFFEDVPTPQADSISSRPTTGDRPGLASEELQDKTTLPETSPVPLRTTRSRRTIALIVAGFIAMTVSVAVVWHHYTRPEQVRPSRVQSGEHPIDARSSPPKETLHEGTHVSAPDTDDSAPVDAGVQARAPRRRRPKLPPVEEM